MKQAIEHVVPWVSLVRIRLFEPADRFYAFLQEIGEVDRLKRLRHLGGLARAFPGAEHTRWDYAVATLHYAERLAQLSGMRSSFKVGKAKFSSCAAALQTAALCWSIGHLPGTFAVEKGVYRMLRHLSSEDPARVLPWPSTSEAITSARLKKLLQVTNDYLDEYDYLGLARVLAAIKLLNHAGQCCKSVRQVTEDFCVPFLLEEDDPTSQQWPKVRQAFELARRLAYLTLDAPLAGLLWCPPVPLIFAHAIQEEDQDLERLAEGLGEILSPVDRLVYLSVYHRVEARRRAAELAARVYQHLRDLAEDEEIRSVIADWMTKPDIAELELRQPQFAYELAGSIQLRSFLPLADRPPGQLEDSLAEKGASATVLIYSPWYSDKRIEPDEVFFDLWLDQDPCPQDVGRMLLWFIESFHEPDARPDNDFYMMKKMDMEPGLVNLLARAVELSVPEYNLEVRAWPLRDLGLFENTPLEWPRGAVWPCETLDEPIVKHIVRKKDKAKIARRLESVVDELSGLRELRSYLLRRWRSDPPGQCCLLITASIRLQAKDGRNRIEFDGGIVTISSVDGFIHFYALETKGGRGKAAESLQRRLQKAGLRPSQIKPLAKKHAFAELELDAPKKKTARKNPD